MFRKSGSPQVRQQAAHGLAGEDRQQGVANQQRGRVQHSFISADAKFAGDLISDGDVTIEGTVDGSINCRCLTLSGQPIITGKAEADSVLVCGTFSGEIHASKVVLGKTAKMLGDVFQECLEVYPGAFFEGKVSRLKAKAVEANGAFKTTVLQDSEESDETDVSTAPAA